MVDTHTCNTVRPLLRTCFCPELKLQHQIGGVVLLDADLDHLLGIGCGTSSCSTAV